MSLASSPLARLTAAAMASAAFAFATVGTSGTAAAGDTVLAVRLFGAGEVANVHIAAFPKWTAALARYERERPLEDQPCAGGHCPLQQWAKFVAGLGGQSPLRQLEAVNDYVNRTPYQDDASRYGRVDYWATPREFLGRSGDCEDYAFAKYLSLRKLGWSPDRLRIVVLMHHQRRELHAVLVAYHNGTAYVLDNLLGRVMGHGALPHYQPIYSINERGWFQHHGWSPGARVAAARPRPGGAGTVLSSRRMSPAARSYAGNADESTASLFTTSTLR